MSDTPLVSVCLITYMHRPYIAQCIENILSQECAFPFELVIGEDDSTDGTREICMDFAARYPEKIRLLLSARKNVLMINGRPTGRYNFINTIKAARGRYIALCEGDDFWTDPQKLQKQIRFLEAHPEFSTCCAHAVKVDAEGKRLAEDPLPDREDFSITDLSKWNFIFTATVVLRTEWVRQAIERPDFLKIPAGDYFIEMLAAAHGPVHYIRETMAGRRIHGGGLWGGKSFAAQVLNEVYCQYIMVRNLQKQPEICRILETAIDESLLRIFKVEALQLEQLLSPFTDADFVALVNKCYQRFLAGRTPVPVTSSGLFSKLKRLLRGGKA